jgi:peptidoglycan/LPS O-acetylase OafA/YrhL
MKSFTFFALAVFVLLPNFAFAQASLQTFIPNLVKFGNDVLIPFLLGIAFLIFIYNVFRYFILDGSNEQSREDAKAFATYSVAAFVFLIIFFGIVNMLATSVGLEGETQQCPDYLKNKGAC